jgi:hypothetical protein
MSSCTSSQNRAVRKHATILSSSLDTIEACGGGSVHDGRSFLVERKKKTFNIEGLFFEL